MVRLATRLALTQAGSDFSFRKKMYVYISENGAASYIELLSDHESDLPTL